jgi:hypothetical protein
VHPIETITKGNNSILEEDSTTALVLSSVKYQAPIKSPNIKIEENSGLFDPPTNEYYIMSEEMSINKLNTEKQ